MANVKKITRISFNIPEEMLRLIDENVEENFITRSKWFFDASKLKLEKDKTIKIDEIIRK